MVFSVGDFSPRSIAPIYVLNKEHFSARPSCERFCFFRKTATRFPKATLIFVFIVIYFFCEDTNTTDDNQHSKDSIFVLSLPFQLLHEVVDAVKLSGDVNLLGTVLHAVAAADAVAGLPLVGDLVIVT